jgi:3-isopropylmalate dehydrogenase
MGRHHKSNPLLKAAAAVEKAVDAVLQDKDSRTPDLGGRTGTRAFARLVADRIG